VYTSGRLLFVHDDLLMTFYLFSVLLLVVAAVGGIWFSHGKMFYGVKSDFVYYGEGFSAGVFLGASLLHMLPDAIVNLKLQSSFWEYPIATLLCAGGFLLLYLIEQFTVSLLKVKNKDELAATAITYLLFVVLSIHSVLVGVSLGLEVSAYSAVMIILALFLHKASAGFALGVSMVRSSIPLFKRALLTTIFAVSAPLGVLIGSYFLVLAKLHISGLAQGLFDALAAGTFLFMAMHFSQTSTPLSSKNRIITLLMILFGFLIMAFLALYV
jgi:solute carrier family 39 (zinc transporter), member 1/2/3